MALYASRVGIPKIGIKSSLLCCGGILDNALVCSERGLAVPVDLSTHDLCHQVT